MAARARSIHDEVSAPLQPNKAARQKEATHMSHEFESGLFVVEPAWHGLGVVLESAPGPAEALKLAGLDWTVTPRPLFLADRTIVDEHRAMVRSSDGAILGVVGSDYTPVQNVEAFAEIAPLIESGEATIEAAGSLRGGKRVWILAAIKAGTVDVTKGDAIKAYVLFAHGHDGNMSIRYGFTKVRVVCQNTLSMAMYKDNAKQLAKIRHTKGVKSALAKAREGFDMQRAELKKSAETYRELARRGMDGKNLVRYVREVLKPGAADDDKITVRNVDKIAELFESGRGAELSRGTVWGAYNAITEYATHLRGNGQDARQNSNWFGDGAQLVDRALEVAIQFAEDAPLAEQSRAAYTNHATAKAELDVLLSRPATAPVAAEQAPSGDLASLLKKPRRTAADDAA